MSSIKRAVMFSLAALVVFSLLDSPLKYWNSKFSGLPPLIMPVPLHQQEQDYSCGAAAFYSILRYWQVFNGLEKDLYHMLSIDPQTGTSGLKIIEVAKSFGLDAYRVTDLTLDGLRALFGEGKTIILELQAWPEKPIKHPWNNEWDSGHYVVLVGMDEQYAYLMDGAVNGGYVFVPLNELLDRWHNWAESEDETEKKLQHLAIVIFGAHSIGGPIMYSKRLIRLE